MADNSVPRGFLATVQRLVWLDPSILRGSLPTTTPRLVFGADSFSVVWLAIFSFRYMGTFVPFRCACGSVAVYLWALGLGSWVSQAPILSLTKRNKRGTKAPGGTCWFSEARTVILTFHPTLGYYVTSYSTLLNQMGEWMKTAATQMRLIRMPNIEY